MGFPSSAGALSQPPPSVASGPHSGVFPGRRDSFGTGSVASGAVGPGAGAGVSDEPVWAGARAAGGAPPVRAAPHSRANVPTSSSVFGSGTGTLGPTTPGYSPAGGGYSPQAPAGAGYSPAGSGGLGSAAQPSASGNRAPAPSAHSDTWASSPSPIYPGSGAAPAPGAGVYSQGGSGRDAIPPGDGGGSALAALLGDSAPQPYAPAPLGSGASPGGSYGGQPAFGGSQPAGPASQAGFGAGSRYSGQPTTASQPASTHQLPPPTRDPLAHSSSVRPDSVRTGDQQGVPSAGGIAISSMLPPPFSASPRQGDDARSDLYGDPSATPFRGMRERDGSLTGSPDRYILSGHPLLGDEHFGMEGSRAGGGLAPLESIPAPSIPTVVRPPPMDDAAAYGMSLEEGSASASARPRFVPPPPGPSATMMLPAQRKVDELCAGWKRKAAGIHSRIQDHRFHLERRQKDEENAGVRETTARARADEDLSVAARSTAFHSGASPRRDSTAPPGDTPAAPPPAGDKPPAPR
eukprot:Hpha_TRINITY_DN16047_c1_g8::TRINITY_DN16047_c1_g8_i1::g.121208::m.121208